MSKWRDWALEFSLWFGVTGEIDLRNKAGDKAVRMVRFPIGNTENENREGKDKITGNGTVFKGEMEEKCQMIQNQEEKER